MWLFYRGRVSGNGTNTFCFSSLPMLPGWHLICAWFSTLPRRWNRIVNVLKWRKKGFRFDSLSRHYEPAQRLGSRIPWPNLYSWWTETKQTWCQSLLMRFNKCSFCTSLLGIYRCKAKKRNTITMLIDLIVQWEYFCNPWKSVIKSDEKTKNLRASVITWCNLLIFTENKDEAKKRSQF